MKARDRKEDLARILIHQELARLEHQAIAYLNKKGAGIEIEMEANSYRGLAVGMQEVVRCRYHRGKLMKAAAKILRQPVVPNKLKVAAHIARSMPWLWRELEAGRTSWRFAASIAAASSEFPRTSTAERVTRVRTAEVGSAKAATLRSLRSNERKPLIHELAFRFSKKRPHDIASAVIRELEKRDLPSSKTHVYAMLRDHPLGHWKK